MKLDRLMHDLNDDTKYRFHLAKTEPGGRHPLHALARSREDWLNWQVYRGNAKERFPKNCVVSFAQISGDRFLFGGIFDIVDRAGETYEVAYTEAYEELIGRLIVNYRGKNKRATVFTPGYIYENTEVAGIYEHKFKGEPFKSFDEINHGFSEIELIVKNNLNDWRVALSSVYGVYLISDKTTGKHYVGSAYGQEGVWGRWNQYVYNFHGNNADLVELFEKKTEAYFRESFKFSILEVLSSAATSESIIAREKLWKQKLLSNEFGYNRN